jgi:hypothetical protein
MNGVEAMSEQDTGKFRGVHSAESVETVTSEDGRIEFVIGDSVPGIAEAAERRVAPVQEAEQEAVTASLLDRLKVAPKWMLAVPVALLVVGLGVSTLGSGSGASSDEDAEAIEGFRPYGGGPVSGNAGRAQGAASTSPANRPARPTTANPRRDFVDDVSEVDDEVYGQVRPSLPPPPSPSSLRPHMPPNADQELRPQDLSPFSTGMTPEQREILKELLPPPQAVAPNPNAPGPSPIERSATVEEGVYDTAPPPPDEVRPVVEQYDEPYPDDEPAVEAEDVY